MGDVKMCALHAYLTPRSFDTWRYFADENGVSVTGLLEALALQLTEDLEATGNATTIRQDWVKSARIIDALRRRRTRNGS